MQGASRGKLAPLFDCGVDAAFLVSFAPVVHALLAIHDINTFGK